MSVEPLPPRPAWHALEDEAGIQDFAYPDNPRLNVHALFGHAPRRVLDIGCAAGAVGMGIKQAFPGAWVWGCELSPRAADIAATRLDHVSRTSREHWGAEESALLASVDTVMLLDVLEHMYNPWAELRHLAGVLQPDSQVIVSLPNAGHWSVLTGLAAGGFRYEEQGILDVTHIRFFTRREMHAMFQETGFRVEAEAALSATDMSQVSAFPAQVDFGKSILRVDDAQEWLGLNAIQFGFRLSVARGASAQGL